MSLANAKLKKQIANVETEDQDNKDPKARKKSALDATTNSSSKSIISTATNRESKLKPILISTTPGV